MSQLQRLCRICDKRFSDEQVKVLLGGFCQGVLSRAASSRGCAASSRGCAASSRGCAASSTERHVAVPGVPIAQADIGLSIDASRRAPARGVPARGTKAVASSLEVGILLRPVSGRAVWRGSWPNRTELLTALRLQCYNAARVLRSFVGRISTPRRQIARWWQSAVSDTVRSETRELDSRRNGGSNA